MKILESVSNVAREGEIKTKKEIDKLSSLLNFKNQKFILKIINELLEIQD